MIGDAWNEGHWVYGGKIALENGTIFDFNRGRKH